jgi:cell wall-associated NlpC family hydrolase
MRLLPFAPLLLIAGCGYLSKLTPAPAPTAVALPAVPTQVQTADAAPERPTNLHGHEIVLFALGLIDTGYRFGGKNPEAGLDCSGMVSYVFENAAGLRLTGSAADIAKRGRPVNGAGLRPGDLVFFNTRKKPRSHVGIYIGDGRFIHAPNSNGKVRKDNLLTGWFATRFEEARTYFD